MGDRPRRRGVNLRSRARSSAPEPDRRGFPTLRKVLDGIKEHESKLSAALSRAEKDVVKLKECLKEEEQYSACYKQQRDEAEKKLSALQNDAEALRGQKDKGEQEVLRLQALVDEKTKALSEMESTLGELKRIKNGDRRVEEPV